MFGLAEDVRPLLLQAFRAGKPLVLATLTTVEGGGPRPPGTQMVFADGVVGGYFSGGCVESDVADHAFACLADGEPRTLVYGEGSPWPDIRLLCGARIEIFLEKIGAEDPALAELLAAYEARRPVVWTSDGRRRVCAAATGGWPGAISRSYAPVQRMVVFGSDPTALAIAALSAQAGLETTLVRPKGPEQGPPLLGVAYSRAEPERALEVIGTDPWTAVAVATHDLETDQAALRAALSSTAGYVGLLGARARLPERQARLRATGVSDADIARLHAPIGLPIGGKAPWEVAVSVVGQVMSLRQAASRAADSAQSAAE